MELKSMYGEVIEDAAAGLCAAAVGLQRSAATPAIR